MEPAAVPVPPALLRSRSIWDTAGHSLRRSPITMVAVGFLVALTMAAVFAQVVAPADPLKQDLLNNRLAPAWWPGQERQGGVLGTDALGRDVLSRIIHGARISLLVAIVAVLLAGTLGVLLGLIAGYKGGTLDNVVIGIGDAFLALPLILLVITIIAVLGTGLTNLILALAISGWVPYARIVRGEVLVVKGRLYVEAARAVGVSGSSIMFRHILPNVVSPVVVISSFSMAQVILTEAALSFLGLGVQPPTPTWGGMLADAQEQFVIAPWVVIFPGVAIVLAVLAVNIVGDWIRDVMDPRLRM